MGLLPTETLRAKVDPFEESYWVRSEFIVHETSSKPLLAV